MTFAELEALCREAARDLLRRESRPLPAAVVLPLPEATRVTTLPDFPADDPTRFDLLARFAADVMRPANAAAFCFVAEATVDGVAAVVVVCGARHHPARIAAAALVDDHAADFGESEELDPTAMPFLSPLRHAADAATPPP